MTNNHKGNTTMKLVRLTIAALAITLATATSAGALENLPTPRAMTAVSYNTNAAKDVRVIGDSISWLDQPAYYAYAFGSAGWGTTVHSLWGANMIEHRVNWGSFAKAAASTKTKAVVVALGTNDLSDIRLSRPDWSSQLQKVFNEATSASKTLSAAKKCTLFWTASTESPGHDASVARAYNLHLVSLSMKTPGVFLADYDALVRTNATYRKGLFPLTGTLDGKKLDGVHPQGGAARSTLAVWLRDQVRWFCKI